MVDVFILVFRLRKDGLFWICYKDVYFNASHDTEIGFLYLVVTWLCHLIQANVGVRQYGFLSTFILSSDSRVIPRPKWKLRGSGLSTAQRANFLGEK